VVKIFMLRTDGVRPVFYVEPGEGVHEAGPGRGVRGWLARKSRALHEALERSESWGGRQLRRGWAWLHQRIAPDETLLRGLRKAEGLTLHHPATLTEAEARAAWEAYLAGRRRHHLLWLAVNGVASPFSVLLAPLPGPNVLGYWFVYRAVCHALAVLGIRRAGGGRLATSPSPALDTPLGPGDDEAVARVAASHDLTGLADYLKRVPKTRAEARDAAMADR
jgi:hypothetical protein